MKRVELKLSARQQLAEKTAKSRLTVLIYLLFRLCFTALSVFFVYSVYLLPQFIKNEPFGIPGALYYTLFFFCLLILIGFSSLFHFLLRRWFFLNSEFVQISDFFIVLPVRLQLKIIYLHFLCFSRRFSLWIFYMFPLAGLLTFLRIKLENGIDSRQFGLCCVLGVIYLLLGLYYMLASRQKTAFDNEEITLSPSRSAQSIYSDMCKRKKENCFCAAKLKLSFLMWYCLCILVFPILFVMPYYLQTLSEYKKADLEEQGL